jgi:hypothetical protein
LWKESALANLFLAQKGVYGIFPVFQMMVRVTLAQDRPGLAVGNVMEEIARVERWSQKVNIGKSDRR